MYRKGIKSDYENILDFLNYAFSSMHGPIDFKRLLPKIYGEDAHKEKIHHLILEDGKIKGSVSVYPMDLQVGKEKLKVAYVGSVAVHPYSRGKGIMRELMDYAREEIGQEGYDLAVVSGQRQRYENCGFYRGGQCIQYVITEKNMKIFFDRKNKSKMLNLSQMEDDMELNIVLQENNEDEFMDAIYELYSTQIIQGRSRKEFFDIMSSFDSELLALTMHGVCIGYFSFQPEEEYINEIVIVEPSLLPYFLRELMDIYGIDQLGVKMGLLEKEVNKILTPLCERYTIGQAQMYHILNLKKVLKVLLEAQKAVKHLKDGAVILGMNSDTVKVCIEKGKVSVDDVDEFPEVKMNEEQIIRILMSNDYRMACMYDEVIGLEYLPEGWFPLPLQIKEVDMI